MYCLIIIVVKCELEIICIKLELLYFAFKANNMRRNT